MLASGIGGMEGDEVGMGVSNERLNSASLRSGWELHIVARDAHHAGAAGR
jgi:hypothetical protein